MKQISHRNVVALHDIVETTAYICMCGRPRPLPFRCPLTAFPMPAHCLSDARSLPFRDLSLPFCFAAFPRCSSVTFFTAVHEVSLTFPMRPGSSSSATATSTSTWPRQSSRRRSGRRGT